MNRENKNHTRIHLYTCPDVGENCSLCRADQINVYVHDTNAVALMRSMSVKELVHTIDELEFLLSSLTAKLLNKIFCEEEDRGRAQAIRTDRNANDLRALLSSAECVKGKHEREKDPEPEVEPDYEIPGFLFDLLRKFGLDPELVEIAISSNDTVET